MHLRNQLLQRFAGLDHQPANLAVAADAIGGLQIAGQLAPGVGDSSHAGVEPLGWNFGRVGVERQQPVLAISIHQGLDLLFKADQAEVLVFGVGPRLEFGPAPA